MPLGGGDLCLLPMPAWRKKQSGAAHIPGTRDFLEPSKFWEKILLPAYLYFYEWHFIFAMHLHAWVVCLQVMEVMRLSSIWLFLVVHIILSQSLSLSHSYPLNHLYHLSGEGKGGELGD